jgi:hypothetical protein
MNNRDIEWRRKKLERIRHELESGQMNAIRQLVSNEVIEQICEDHHYEYRKRLLTPIVTVFHMISAAITGEGSFQSAWQRNGQTGRSGVLAEARKRLPYEVWQELDQWMKRQIEAEANGDPRWRGHRMVGVDGTGISMSDEPELSHYFGHQKTQTRDSLFPLARLVVAFNLKTLVSIAHELGAYKKGEKSLFKEGILRKLHGGDVVVFDRHFAGANLYVHYQLSGIEFIGQTHPCLKVERLKVMDVFAETDLLVEMPILKHHRQADPRLPKSVTVRLIRARRKREGKKEVFWIATSLCDPKRYPADEIIGWHKKRWKIETLIKEIKLTFWSGILRSRTISGIHKEFYSRMVALNLIHWLILKVAHVSHQAPERISVSAAIRMTYAFSLKMSTAPIWQLPMLYQTLLQNIAASILPNRPNRMEPRMVKRIACRHYPKLRIPRADWKTLYAAAA